MTLSVEDTRMIYQDGPQKKARIGAFDFETGARLKNVEIAFETWGELNADGTNAVLIVHALTGDTHVAATEADPTLGWWEQLVGPGKPVDTNKWFVVAPNILGGCYGSTGPASEDEYGLPYGSRFPFVTVRDSVRAEAAMADLLGIKKFKAVIGGSLGGARALEWAATYPNRVDGAAVIASNAYTTAEQIAFSQAQINAIQLDPLYNNGDYYSGAAPTGGLGIARRIAHITYRSEAELGGRFGRQFQGSENPFGWPQRRQGRYQVESYLDYQAAKLVDRFDANSYVHITEALMTHDIGRDRGGVANALAGIKANMFICAVTSDRLFFPEQSQELADLLPTVNGEPVKVHMIDSPIGHDGFLTQIEQVADAMVATLEL